VLNINDFLIEVNFTTAYKKYINDDISIREAMCLKEMYPLSFSPIQPQDLFAGRINFPAIGFSAEPPGGYCFYFDKELFENKLKLSSLTPSEEKKLKELQSF
jgi:hypothetical protein